MTHGEKINFLRSCSSSILQGVINSQWLITPFTFLQTQIDDLTISVSVVGYNLFVFALHIGMAAVTVFFQPNICCHLNLVKTENAYPEGKVSDRLHDYIKICNRKA